MSTDTTNSNSEQPPADVPGNGIPHQGSAPTGSSKPDHDGARSQALIGGAVAVLVALIAGYFGVRQAQAQNPPPAAPPAASATASASPAAPRVSFVSPSDGDVVARGTQVLGTLSAPLRDGEQVWMATRDDQRRIYSADEPCTVNRDLSVECPGMFLGPAGVRLTGVVSLFVVTDSTAFEAYAQRSTPQTNNPGWAGPVVGLVDEASVLVTSEG